MIRNPYLLSDDDPCHNYQRDPHTASPSDAEWLKEFPEEVGAILTGKISELKAELRHIKHELSRKVRRISETETDEFAGWFAKEWLRTTDATQIAELEAKISHFKRLLRISDRGPSSWERAINAAREIPIMDIVGLDMTLRRSGKSHVARCPLHEEHTPSFHVYPDQNTFHCFGCGAHGDAISYAMLRNKLTFKDAVRLLSGGCDE